MRWLEQLFFALSAKPEILIYSPAVRGGVAEYTYCQVGAFEKAGADVICLVPPGFLDGRAVRFKTDDCLWGPPPSGGGKFLRRLRLAGGIVLNAWLLAGKILRHRPGLVLLDSYAEYLSPLWIWPHWWLARFRRVKYAANLHDPVRNHAVGPRWWHRLSVRLAYLPLSFVTVHDRLAEPSPVPRGVRVVEVPHGLYEIAAAPVDPMAVRRAWGVSPGQKVFLSFGHVRDGKNIHLAVRALAQIPDAFLVVAGAVASANDKPFAYYRELAGSLGVAGRCRFIEGYVSDGELAGYFSAADFVLLTYAATFHSQSGVLNIAAKVRKPVLASASPCPLVESVRRYDLGIAVAPDSLEAIVAGMRRLMESPPSPQWEAYEAAAAWDINAMNILEAAGFADSVRPGNREIGLV